MGKGKRLVKKESINCLQAFLKIRKSILKVETKLLKYSSMYKAHAIQSARSAKICVQLHSSFACGQGQVSMAWLLNELA